MSWVDEDGVVHKASRWSVINTECGIRRPRHLSLAQYDQPVTCFWCISDIWWDQTMFHERKFT